MFGTYILRSRSTWRISFVEPMTLSSQGFLKYFFRDIRPLPGCASAALCKLPFVLQFICTFLSWMGRRSAHNGNTSQCATSVVPGNHLELRVPSSSCPPDYILFAQLHISRYACSAFWYNLHSTVHNQIPHDRSCKFITLVQITEHGDVITVLVIS